MEQIQVPISSLPEARALYTLIGDIDESRIRSIKNTSDIENLKLSNNINILNHEILWKVQTDGKEAIYSSPILQVLSSAITAIIYVGWDWFVYCRNSSDGSLIWKFPMEENGYGRCQSYVDSDGYIRIFASSHGHIYCLNELGELQYKIENLYDREGNGNVTSAGNYYFVDSSKNWITNSFIHGNTVGGNSSVSIISGTGANQTKEISGVENGNKIWLFDDWDVTPDSTSVYKIIPKFESDRYFQHCGQLSLENSIEYLYITGFDGMIVKVAASTGEIIFRYGTLGNIEPYVFVTENEVISVSLDCYVYSLDHQGNLLWKTLMPDGMDAFINLKYAENGEYNILIS